MGIVTYLAGPDVFLPDARAHARRKLEICARHGLVGHAPLDGDPGDASADPSEPAWQALFRRLLASMERCDAVIANLTPFRGPSADAGTLIELGWFLGRGRPAFGYSNCARPFAERTGRHLEAAPDPLPGIAVEAHGLPDNLMVPGAVLEGGGLPVVLPPDGRDRAFDALDVFERCVEAAAWRVGVRPRPGWCPPG